MRLSQGGLPTLGRRQQQASDSGMSSDDYLNDYFVSRVRTEGDLSTSAFKPKLATADASSSPPKIIVRSPQLAPSTHKFSLLQSWEGVVSAVSEAEFVAILRDLSKSNQPEEQATFPMDAVAEPDHSLVALGAVFYWVIGYEVTVTGTRKTVSILRFRRLPAWTKSDLLTAKREAQRLSRLFDTQD